MKCHMIGNTRCYADQNALWSSWMSRKLDWETINGLESRVAMRMGSQRFTHLHRASIGKHDMRHMTLRTFSNKVSLEVFSSIQVEDRSSDDEYDYDGYSEEPKPRLPTNEQLTALLLDTERINLTKKLSEANQHNRHMKRQLIAKEDSLADFKSELAAAEIELQTLVSLAEEISTLGIPKGSRKINGKYIQSHLHLRLEAMCKKLKRQIKGVEAVQAKEVPLVWYDMAESVQVMGTFDGWAEGEHLSAEYMGSYTKFSTILMLRPGRYEIKFLVDGEWRLSRDLPVVGEGLMENNLLIVE